MQADSSDPSLKLCYDDGHLNRSGRDDTRSGSLSYGVLDCGGVLDWIAAGRLVQ